MNILLLFLCFIIVFIIVLCYERKIRNLSVKPKNNVHFYVARDKCGELWLYIGKPNRYLYTFASHSSSLFTFPCNTFDCFGLNEDDYANLKWEDEPVEVFVNMVNIMV